MKTDDSSDGLIPSGSADYRVPATTGESLPLGLRITMGFVRVMAVVMIFPLLGAAFGALFAVIGGALAENPVPEPLLTALALVLLVGLLLAMFGSAGWFIEHLKSRQSGLAAKQRAHPGRQICLPTLMVVAIYGLFATLVWIPSTLKNDFMRTYPWPVVWCSISTAAVFLARHLDRNLPGGRVHILDEKLP